jgi:hypothetical protein
MANCHCQLPIANCNCRLQIADCICSLMGMGMGMGMEWGISREITQAGKRAFWWFGGV